MIYFKPRRWNIKNTIGSMKIAANSYQEDI